MLEKIMVDELFQKKKSTFYEARRFIIVFT